VNGGRVGRVDDVICVVKRTSNTSRRQYIFENE